MYHQIPISNWNLTVVDRGVAASFGFKSPPDADGVVEIAYGIVPNQQGAGLATETATALVSFASSNEKVRRIRADTLPEPNASTQVLKKCGFEFIGEVADPEDGRVWRWERAPENLN